MVAHIILLALLGVNYALYLEVCKNRIFGWILAVIFFVIYCLVRFRILGEKAWYIKLACLVVFLGLLVGNAIWSAPKEQCVSAGNGDKTGYTDIVKVEQGELQGILNEEGTVDIFAGIPYAAPPVGELRWKEPQAAESWDGVKVCDTYGPMAMQSRSNAFYSFASTIIGYHENPMKWGQNYIEAMSEDCLYLNVWRPEGAEEGDDLPVLFYIHGGSLNSGQSYYQDYNGETLASQGAIVVTISYRLGVFGYLADAELAEESPNGTTGNYGLLDQIAALKWVHDNIASFGGDADNITIAGESAGSSSVNAICVSPLAKGLFRRAIAESSSIVAKVPYHTFRTMGTAQEKAASIKEEFGCSSIEELRQVSAEDLVKTKYSNNEMTVDGYAITKQPYLTYLEGNNNEEALLSGYNGDESYVFQMFAKMPKVDQYEEFVSQVLGEYAGEMVDLLPVTTDKEAETNYRKVMDVAWFCYSHYAWSELMASEDRPTYLYYFTKDNKSIGDWHSGEMPYFYGNLKHNGNYKADDYALSETMQGYILNFVKTGDPNGDGLPTWESYNDNPTQVLHLDSSVQMEDNGYLEMFKIFDKYQDSLTVN